MCLLRDAPSSIKSGHLSLVVLLLIEIARVVIVLRSGLLAVERVHQNSPVFFRRVAVFVPGGERAMGR